MSAVKTAYSKKNPSKKETYSAEINIDLPNVVSGNQINEILNNLFESMKTTIDSQIDCVIDCTPVIESKLVRSLPSLPEPEIEIKKTYSKGHSSNPASDKQLNLLKTLASANNISITELEKENKPISELSSKECHDLIQIIKAK